MSNPQQPELARSRKTPAQDADAVAGVLDGQRDVGAEAPRGPVPPENQPGHHPADEQDKPPLDKFAAKLGTMEPEERKDVLKDEPPSVVNPAPAPAQAQRPGRRGCARRPHPGRGRRPAHPQPALSYEPTTEVGSAARRLANTPTIPSMVVWPPTGIWAPSGLLK